jgi:S1-C subfamily serine protease
MQSLSLISRIEEYDKNKSEHIFKIIGLSLKQIDQELANIMEVNVSSRMCVWATEPGKASEKCGLRVGDIIIEINDIDIISRIDVEEALNSQTPDTPIRFLLRRFDSIQSLAYMAVWY